MSSRKKICLIYTGGTIGMQRVGKALKPPPDDEAEDFIRKVAPELSEMADFKFVPLMNKDSTNINHEDWKTIAEAIYSRADQYRGFVIAHGTDTMHFTASAVAFALGENLNFPVVFTGAQTNPDVRHGDARVNLVRAFQVCATDLAEVAICFGEFVFRGCRAQKKDERRFDAFESPSYYPIAFITEQILLTPLAKLRRPHRPPINFRPHFADGIVQWSRTRSDVSGLRIAEMLRSASPILRGRECPFRGEVFASRSNQGSAKTRKTHCGYKSVRSWLHFLYAI
jgi:L-asparaginase